MEGGAGMEGARPPRRGRARGSCPCWSRRSAAPAPPGPARPAPGAAPGGTGVARAAPLPGTRLNQPWASAAPTARARSERPGGQDRAPEGGSGGDGGGLRTRQSRSGCPSRPRDEGVLPRMREARTGRARQGV